ncbi:hypothetical protein [Bacillus alkalicellulosilyticus]|uniref:hypothetical protein n=1 Tax=Alkalihalobacterium alkalicellulosilyticum TaxID=1912214 RepID=UPI00099660DA|nr:hypothetical protein [Bacillus alkalicellulosilyticus]
MKKKLLALLLITVVGLLGFAFIPGFLDIHQSRMAATEVLDHVIKQEYEEAFESVYYFDIASDIEPLMSYDDAKEKWVERVTTLRDQGTYIVDYKQLRVRLDDTYPTGTVDLIMIENGEKVIKDDVRLWFAPIKEDKWKLGSFNYQGEAWEEELSGNFVTANES